MDRAEVVREGTDVTLIAYGPTVRTALEAADAAAAEGLSIEVVDLRSLSPFDDETVGASVRKTSRAAVIHEAAQFGGYGAEVAARVTERNFHHLAAPVLRIAGFDIPYPVAEARGVPPADRRPRARRARHLGVGRMSREFILPDLGEGLTEAEIVAWLVAPGDEVAIDQPVVELESAKSVVQLPTPFAGVVESLGGEVGQVLHAGSVLMTLAAALGRTEVRIASRHGRRGARERRRRRRARCRRAEPRRRGVRRRADRLRHASRRRSRSARRRHPHGSGAGQPPAAAPTASAGSAVGAARGSTRPAAPPSCRRSCAASPASTASMRASSTARVPITS